MGNNVKRTAKSGKRSLVLRGIALMLALALADLLWKQFVYIEGDYTPAEDTSRSFRTALSLSPFSLTQFEQGYSFRMGDLTAMDMETQQAPRFEEYPEIYALQNGKDWSELSLEEICTVLEAYGAFVAESILRTGCTVQNWNLGNEANFGFAGISLGLKTAVNPKLEQVPD